MRTKINLASYSDAQRKIYIQYIDEKFFVMFQDVNEMNEYAVEYSFEAFIRTFNVMDEFFKELALNDKEVVLKLTKMDKLNSKIKYSYV